MTFEQAKGVSYVEKELLIAHSVYDENRQHLEDAMTRLQANPFGDEKESKKELSRLRAKLDNLQRAFYANL